MSAWQTWTLDIPEVEQVPRRSIEHPNAGHMGGGKGKNNNFAKSIKIVIQQAKKCTVNELCNLIEHLIFQPTSLNV